jgi:hypothetical protein
MPSNTVSDTKSQEPTPEAHATTMVVPMKIVADKYNEFLDFLRDCKYVY